jgi:hypothetical protein
MSASNQRHVHASWPAVSGAANLQQREQKRGANRSRAFYVFVMFINAAIRFFA